MKSYSLQIQAIVFLIFAGISLHLFYTNVQTKENYNIVRVIPERFRSFLAAILWEKAEHLMHQGPAFSKQKFYAGSYAGNTDILPYIKMVIALYPKEFSPYRILAGNYAYHLKMKKEAMKIMEEAIKNCSSTAYIHEVYASYSFILLFAVRQDDSMSRKDELKLALYYIDKAIDNYKMLEDQPDAVFKTKNYFVIKSRILWELKEYDLALDSWLKCGEKLEESPDRLSAALLKYQQTGIAEKLELPVEASEQATHIPSYHSTHIHDHTHNH